VSDEESKPHIDRYSKARVLAKDNQALQKRVVKQKQESKTLDSTAALLCHSSASCSWLLDLSSVTTNG
jgi:hypothetical protein